MPTTQEIVARLKAILDAQYPSIEKFARDISAAGFDISTSGLASILSGRTKTLDVLLLLAVSRAAHVPFIEIVGLPSASLEPSRSSLETEMKPPLPSDKSITEAMTLMEQALDKLNQKFLRMPRSRERKKKLPR